MIKLLFFALSTLSSIAESSKLYPWIEGSPSIETIKTRIATPIGFTRVKTKDSTFADWVRNLPLKPKGTPLKLWNGENKWSQDLHVAVVDLDFIGKDLQQCVDVVIRLRAEYLRSMKQDADIAFTYSCCREPIPWTKWREGWRTKIIKPNGVYSFEWVKKASYDDSRANFKKYLFDIMMYAGTMSLSKDMKTIKASEVQIGDAFVQGGAPGYGHGLIIVDMATSKDGEKIMLLAQGYTPAENMNVLKSKDDISPWFRCNFGDELRTPQWTFKQEHARRFE